MASPALIGLSLLAGGAAAFAVYKAWQAKNATTTQNLCSGFCGSDTSCNAACNGLLTVGKDIVEAVNPFTNSDQTWQTQVMNDLASNDKLNGPIAIPLSTAQTVAVEAGYDEASVMVGGAEPPTGAYAGGGQGALVYANGCVPFAGAPGFAQCARGTVSMWGHDVNARAGTTWSQPDPNTLPVPARGETELAGDLYGSSETETYYTLKMSALLTGQGGDAATAGPFGTAASGEVLTIPYSGGGIWELVQTDAEAAQGSTWLARGTRITCPVDQAPKSVIASILGLQDNDPPGTETCIDPNDPRLLCNGTQAPAGMTWSNDTQSWGPLPPNQAVNNGPCGPTASSAVAIGTTGIAVKAVTALGLTGGGRVLTTSTSADGIAA